MKLVRAILKCTERLRRYNARRMRSCLSTVAAQFAIALLLLAGTLHGAEPLRVLFIGNSYTFFNNSPEIFAELARAAAPGREVVTKMVAAPGATLISLWEAQDALLAIRSSKWDYVVLQDQSQLGSGLRDGKFVVNAASLMNWGVSLFDGEIRKAGARTVLLLTWSRQQDAADQQADLNYAYDSMARDLAAILVPAGPAWQKLRQESPAINLYADDGTHPSPAGSYLMACVLVESLIPNSVAAALPATVWGHLAINGEVDMSHKVPLVSLKREEVKAIQNAAKSVVDELRHTGGTLNASKPMRQTYSRLSGGPIAPQDLTGSWTGSLTYYSSPAFLNVTLQFAGKTCQGQVVIQIPEGKQRYEAPASNCGLSGDRLSFSVSSLPLPFLLDRFVGTLTGDRLVGTVERHSPELTNSMSGFWSLGREAAPR